MECIYHDVVKCTEMHINANYAHICGVDRTLLLKTRGGTFVSRKFAKVDTLRPNDSLGRRN